ncbi:MAG: competence protein ComEC [Parcubacteria group bacterium Athens1014_10]|nr:MAG: competence protein ComEC [Parcubacteria group bacterium Athens1014_10]TSD05895.1 MAG: competence protein ComEC [Parcubacteria group bacterium Athens0714_12]
MLKKIIVLVLLIIALSGPTVWQNEFDKNLKVIFLNVGQGDAILIKTPDKKHILIDGGPDNKVIYGLGKNIPFYRQKIDLMILTHSDLDHLTGLIEVLKRYQVKSILYNGLEDDSPEFQEWLKIIKEKNIPLQITQAGDEMKSGEDLILKTIYPFETPAENPENNNNTSVVNKLIYKNISFLFTGDLESEAEEKLLSQNIDLKSDILKVGHHGAKKSTGKNFLRKVKPEYAVISVGKNNFGHPSLRVLKNLQEAGAAILRTDSQGEIKISTDGEKIEIFTSL